MTTLRPEKFFEEMSSNYAAMNLDAIASQFDLPGALYTEEDILVWKDRAALVDILRQHCRRNHSLGSRSARPRVIAESLRAGKKNCSFWVEWKHLDPRGEICFVTQIRYFCRRAEDGSPVIQLVELPRRPAPYLQEGGASPGRPRHRRPRPGALKRRSTPGPMAEAWRREA